MSSPSGRYAAIAGKHCLDVIHERMAAENINPATLAKAIDLNESSAYRYAKGDLNVSFFIVLQYCSYLGVNLSDVMVEVEKRVAKELKDMQKAMLVKTRKAT